VNGPPIRSEAPAAARSGSAPAVEVVDLRKSYGKTHALTGLGFTVPAGTVCGLLGPNGAGKTTAIRILATLARPDSGTARVAGFDAVREPAAVRARIGLAGQHAALDEGLTGRENLRILARLHHLGRRVGRGRADALLERFDLAEAGDRLVKTYSGGMRRRLDVVASMVVAPPVLFLDEPTTGLDPQSREQIWRHVGDLAAEGTTVLLTTQYLEEADRITDRIVVVDHGAAIADGTPDSLKDRIGARIDVTVSDAADAPAAASALARIGRGEAVVDLENRQVSVPVEPGGATVPEAVRLLDAAGIVIEDAALRRPTLDEVFLRLTGGEPASPAAVSATGEGARR
jgi:ABC-2 type transport system ATP-binding protein